MIRVRLAYLSYPFSDDPEARTRQAEIVAKEIMNHEKDIFVIIPHRTFDWYEDDITCLLAELDFIKRKIDLLIIGYQPPTAGMGWEIANAIDFGVPVFEIATDDKNGVAGLKVWRE